MYSDKHCVTGGTVRIITLLLVVVLSLSSFSCKKPATSDSDTDKPIATREPIIAHSISDIPKNSALIDLILPRNNEDSQASVEQKNSDLAAAYENSIMYELKSVDEQSKTASVSVSIPDVGILLAGITEEVIKSNPNKDYTDLLELAKTELEKKLIANDTEWQVFDMQLKIVEKNGNVYFEPSEELQNLIKNSLKNAFLELMIQQWEANDEEN